jgi:hypothetical protein
VNKLNINSFDAAERSMAVDRCKACIDEAVEMGAVELLSLADLIRDRNAEQSQGARFRFTEPALCHAEKLGSIKVVSRLLTTTSTEKALVGPNARSSCVIGPAS